MEIEPPSLNVPLVRKERWGLLLVLVCAGVTGVAALFNPPFALVFAASSIVGLPVLLAAVFPPPVSVRLSAWGDLGRIVVAGALFGYMALAKKVLVPFVVVVIEHALGLV